MFKLSVVVFIPGLTRLVTTYFVRFLIEATLRSILNANYALNFLIVVEVLNEPRLDYNICGEQRR